MFGATPASVANVESYNGSSWTEIADLNTARRLFPGVGLHNSSFSHGGGYNPPGARQGVTEIMEWFRMDRSSRFKLSYEDMEAEELERIQLL